jgi:hypothetical protein
MRKTFQSKTETLKRKDCSQDRRSWENNNIIDVKETEGVDVD